jgi:cobalamin biosynthesis Mg chelatase CobN
METSTSDVETEDDNGLPIVGIVVGGIAVTALLGGAYFTFGRATKKA